MKNLMIFENKEVEVFEFNGQVLFNPYHCGECLELAESSVRNHLANMNSKQAILLKNSDVLNKDIRKLHNTGEKFLTESGVYKLIFRSNKEEAEKFQDWVTDEVLPSIRKHGLYITEELLKDKEKLELKVKMLSGKSKLAESISYLHYSIKYDSDVNSYMPSIIINIFNACRESIVKEDDTHYYFIDKDINIEAMKYDIKSRRFKELLSLMGGCKNSTFVKTEGGYKIRFECYIIGKWLIDSKL